LCVLYILFHSKTRQRVPFEVLCATRRPIKKVDYEPLYGLESRSWPNSWPAAGVCKW